MWGPRFALDVVWGGSAAMLSLILGLMLGALAGGFAAHVGWDGEIAFRSVYLVSSVVLFGRMWQAGMGRRDRVNE